MYYDSIIAARKKGEKNLDTGIRQAEFQFKISWNLPQPKYPLISLAYEFPSSLVKWQTAFATENWQIPQHSAWQTHWFCKFDSHNVNDVYCFCTGTKKAGYRVCFRRQPNCTSGSSIMSWMPHTSTLSADSVAHACVVLDLWLISPRHNFLWCNRNCGAYLAELSLKF